MERFKAYLVEEEKSELTIEKYMRDVRQFLIWLNNRDLTKLEVLAYKSTLIERYAVVSANSVLSSLNCWFGFIDRNDC